MRRISGYGSSGLARSLTLLRTFLVASAAILVVGAFALSATLTEYLGKAALADHATDIGIYADGLVEPLVVHGDRVVVGARARRKLERASRIPEVRGLDVYAKDGRLVFSSTSSEKVGRRRLGHSFLRTMADEDAPTASMVDRPGGADSVLTVWAPLHSARGRVVGAVAVRRDDSAIEATIGDSRRSIWLTVALVFGVLWLALIVLVRAASSRLRRQNDDLAARTSDLVETSRELETTLLETIETLNAAVEARDPYTAGHSQRVRRVSLAIGRELRLSAKQLGALSTAALFHDVGKIAMPDSILTKPDKLSRAESAIMREHVTRGAEIVSRISSLRDSIPGIRHHHERWDGIGYPDGFAGADVPVEAAIIAIADAWDAMTTDRPYAVALDLNEAMLQIRAGRGKQFSPAVVDAFWAVARRRPADILPPEAPTAQLAVV